MKRIYKILLIALIVPVQLYSQPEDTLFLIKVDTLDSYRYGYINKNGDIVIQPKYTEARDFNEGLAFVEIDSKSNLWACIDINGNTVYTEYAVFPWEYSEGFANIERTSGNYVFLNKMGINEFNKTFAYCSEFKNGFALIRYESSDNDAVINKKGEIVLDTIYDFFSGFNEGHALIYHNNLPAIIDTNGELTYIDTSYHGFGGEYRYSYFAHGLMPVKIKNKYGYINYKGELIINSVFDYAKPFSEGLAPVSIGDKWGYIDTTWKFIIEPKFEDADAFSEGLAAVYVVDSISLSMGYDKIKFYQSKNAFINKTGEVVIRDNSRNNNFIYGDFWLPQRFKNGVSQYWESYHFAGKIKYVRKDGRIIW